MNGGATSLLDRSRAPNQTRCFDPRTHKKPQQAFNEVHIIRYSRHIYTIQVFPSYPTSLLGYGAFQLPTLPFLNAGCVDCIPANAG